MPSVSQINGSSILSTEQLTGNKSEHGSVLNGGLISSIADESEIVALFPLYIICEKAIASVVTILFFPLRGEFPTNFSSSILKLIVVFDKSN